MDGRPRAAEATIATLAPDITGCARLQMAEVQMRGRPRRSDAVAAANLQVAEPPTCGKDFAAAHKSVVSALAAVERMHGPRHPPIKTSPKPC